MNGLDPSREPTEADEQYLNNLQNELDTFVADVKRGRA
jgi:hypothetical protein